MNSGNLKSQREYKCESENLVMRQLYLDIDRDKQRVIMRELLQKINLSSRKLAATLGWNRSSLFLYREGKHRIPYNRLMDLCRLANVDVNNYDLNFVVIQRQTGKNLDLSGVDESQFQALTSEEWQKVVAVGFLTDGLVYYRKWDNQYMLEFFSSDKNLHAFFQNLVLFSFNERPSAFLKRKNKNLWITYYHRSVNNQMMKKLLSFTKTYSTTKGRCPSLDFILNARMEVKIQAIRFAMSCDGSVSIRRNNGGYSLRLACAHPKLDSDWQKVFSDVGISTCIDRDKRTWSGIHGLTTSCKESFRRFAEIGGFLPENVKVTNGNFVGFQKNSVLKTILEQRDIALPNGFLSVQLTN